MIKRIFKRKPTAEKALRGMSKALDQLQEVVDHENTEIDRLDVVIENISRERLDAFQRRDRAAKVAERFADLLA